MRGGVSEVVETVDHRCIDICCVQESHHKGCSARLISAKGFKYKFIWAGDNLDFGVVGVQLNEIWIDKVIFVAGFPRWG